MPYTRTWDAAYELTPSDSIAAKLYALAVRNFKVDVRERLDAEHSFGSSGTGRHKFPLLDQAARNAVSDPAFVDGSFNVRNGDNFLVPFLEARISAAWKPVLGYNVGTTSERNAIVTSVIPTGFVFFDTTDGLAYYWNGTAWAVITLTGGGDAGRSPYKNLLINGSFSVWQRGTTSITTGTGTTTNRADRTYVRAAGAACTMERVTTGLPTGAISKEAIKITGATSTTTVDLGQRVEACHRPSYKGILSISCRMKYDDGAAGTVTPVLIIRTPTVEDNWASNNVRLTQAHATAIADGQLVWNNIDVSAYTDINNGVEFIIQMPTGSMNSASKNVIFTDFQVERGIAKTDFEYRGLAIDLPLCKRFYEKTFPYGTAPAQNAGLNGALFAVGTGENSQYRSVMALWKFEVAKRRVISVADIGFYNPLAANTQWWNVTDGVDAGAAALASAVSTDNVVPVSNNAGIASSNGRLFAIHVAVSAEL